MQIPPEWTAMFGRELADAFTPCVNISIGSAMLSEFDYECSVEAVAASSPTRAHPRRTAGDSTRQACVTRKYGEAIRMRDFETVTKLELRFQRPAGAVVPDDAPILVSVPSPRAWGSNCIFVSLQGPSGAPPWAPEPPARPGP
jgi:hypothetical protein